MSISAKELFVISDSEDEDLFSSSVLKDEEEQKEESNESSLLDLDFLVKVSEYFINKLDCVLYTKCATKLVLDSWTDTLKFALEYYFSDKHYLRTFDEFNEVKEYLDDILVEVSNRDENLAAFKGEWKKCLKKILNLKVTDKVPFALIKWIHLKKKFIK